MTNSVGVYQEAIIIFSISVIILSIVFYKYLPRKKPVSVSIPEADKKKKEEELKHE